ncbi:MAG: hypothetical protein GDA49_07735 [Rhodospirillales bacterium]|nr:hypothetical protein [Rhodospirillales bacterium]
MKNETSTNGLKDFEEQKVNMSDADVMRYWLRKVHRGDAAETINRMPVESVEVVVTPPPYNIRNPTGNGLEDACGGKWPKVALIEG